MGGQNGREITSLTIFFQYSKIMVTRVTCQNFIKLTISLVWQCTNIFSFSCGKCTIFKTKPTVKKFWRAALFLSFVLQTGCKKQVSFLFKSVAIVNCSRFPLPQCQNFGFLIFTPPSSLSNQKIKRQTL